MCVFACSFFVVVAHLFNGEMSNFAHIITSNTKEKRKCLVICVTVVKSLTTLTTKLHNLKLSENINQLVFSNPMSESDSPLLVLHIIQCAGNQES